GPAGGRRRRRRVRRLRGRPRLRRHDRGTHRPRGHRGGARPMMPRAGLVLADWYALRSRIAVGGMGEVWRAEDRATGGDVAAKVLRAELAGQEAFLARLRAEARNAARVRHPNVAVLLDSGEQEGSGFLVLELVDGEPLSAI